MRCPALCPNMSSALWRPHAHQSDAQNSGAMVASLLCGSWRFASRGWRWRTGSSKMCTTEDHKYEEPPYWKTNRLDRCKKTFFFLAKMFLSDRSNILPWEAVVCILLLELINHSSFHIQVERGKKTLSNLGAAVSLHSVLHRKNAKERKALWGQEGKLTSGAGYKTKCPYLGNSLPQEGLVWHLCF